MTEPVRIIADYVRRLRWSLQAIPAEDRDGLVREIESHLTDSLAAGPHSLDAAIAAMGPPHAMAARYIQEFRLAGALGAKRLFLLTDVPGVLDKDKNLLTDLTPADIAELKRNGTITGGMIPKLETCVAAVEAGCEAAVVLDGRVGHAMLLEFFTSRGAGTLVRKG